VAERVGPNFISTILGKKESEKKGGVVSRLFLIFPTEVKREKAGGKSGVRGLLSPAPGERGGARDKKKKGKRPLLPGLPFRSFGEGRGKEKKRGDAGRRYRAGGGENFKKRKGNAGRRFRVDEKARKKKGSGAPRPSRQGRRRKTKEKG